MLRFALFLTLLALPAQAERLKVATTFTIIADMAQNVAGDAADVVSITRPGAGIHNFQPTPRDLVNVYDADLLLWNGLNLELWFEQFVQNLGPMEVVTVSDGIEPISITSGEYSGKPNPHAWMGLNNALIYIDNIETALRTADPDNADIYAKNAQEYKQRLIDVIAPLSSSLADLPNEDRWLVTCEGAFSYLAQDLGLHELYLWPMNADQTGTPQQVRAVIDGVREHDIPVVFCESTVSSRPAEQVARETGAEFGGILYVDSLSEADGPVPTYLDLLRVTTETIVTGLVDAK